MDGVDKMMRLEKEEAKIMADKLKALTSCQSRLDKLSKQVTSLTADARVLTLEVASLRYELETLSHVEPK